MIFRMSPPHLVGRSVSRLLPLLISAFAAVSALAQSDPPIPSGDIRDIGTAASAASNVVLVTNEVGCGLVPESPVGRGFRDLQGWVNQEAARSADWVHHVVAGIPVAIKRPEGCR